MCVSETMAKILLDAGVDKHAKNAHFRDPFDVHLAVNESGICRLILSLSERHLKFSKRIDESSLGVLLFTTPRKFAFEAAVDGLFSALRRFNFQIILQIQFTNENATDAGGVFRNWLSLLIERLFLAPILEEGAPPVVQLQTSTQLAPYVIVPTEFYSSSFFSYSKVFKQAPFVANDYECYVLNEEFKETREVWQFVGVIIEMALSNNINLGVKLAPSILKRLLGQILTFEDLKDDDPTLYNSLRELENPEFNLEEAGLYFDSDLDRQVNRENLHEYLEEKARNGMQTKYGGQLEALVQGFRNSIGNVNLRNYFDWRELGHVLTGEQIVDKEELKQYFQFDRDIADCKRLLEQSIDIMSNAELLQLIRFITGQHGLPFGGLKGFQLKFKVAKSHDEYIRAGTCYYILKLPLNFDGFEDFLERLRLAIFSIEEFDEQQYFGDDCFNCCDCASDDD